MAPGTIIWRKGLNDENRPSPSISEKKHSFDIPFMELEKVERWASRQLARSPRIQKQGGLYENANAQ
jgi:hypothetical protein